MLRSQLAGVCIELFSQAKGKSQYDNTLADRAYDGLRKKLDLIIANSNIICPAQISVLVRWCESAGINVHDTYVEILAHLLNKGARIQRGN